MPHNIITCFEQIQNLKRVELGHYEKSGRLAWNDPIMQLKLIDYKSSKHKPLGGRSQLSNDKMRIVFAEEIKCRKQKKIVV